MNISQRLFFIFLISANFLIGNAQTDSLLHELSSCKDEFRKVNIFIKLSKQAAKEDTLNRIAYADSALLLSEKLNDISEIARAKNNKANILLDYKKYQKALKLYLSAVRLAKETESPLLLADIYYNLGSFYYRTDSFSKSITQHEKALLISKTLNDSVRILKSEQAVAVMLWRMGRLKEAEQHYLIALEQAKEIKDTVLVTNMSNSIGAVYWGLGNFHQALKYFNEAAKLSQKTKNHRKLSLIMSNIGLIYKEWGELDKAMNEFQEALKIAKKEKYIYSIAYAYINTGDVYVLKQEYEKARMYYDSALVNYMKNGNKIGMAFSYRNLGNAYLLMKKYQLAIKYYNSSIDAAKKVNTLHHWAIALQGLAQTYFEIGNYTLAKKYAYECLEISIAENYNNIIKDIYFMLSEIAEKEHKPSIALSHYKKASALKDSIFNSKRSEQIAEMQAKYETEKAERENAILRKEEQVKNLQLQANQTKIRNQSIFLTILVTILIFTAFIVFKLLQTRKKLLESQKLLLERNERINLQKEELFLQSKNLTEINFLLNERTKDLEDKKDELQKNLEELKKATEFKNKMFSIIGHDLRGPLGTINSIISLALNKNLTDENRERLLNSVRESSVSAFNLLENLLTWANNEQGKINYQPQNINLKKTILNSYHLLLETANKKSIEINIDIDENYMVYADFNMIDTVFRNLLSNAIKFSYENSKIDVFGVSKENFIELSVRDYGVGMSKDELAIVLDKDKYFSSFGTRQEKGTGIGLQLCFEFIKTNKGTFRIISKKGEGTTISFTLPKAKNTLI